jgi:hypothetical protein
VCRAKIDVACAPTAQIETASAQSAKIEVASAQAAELEQARRETRGSVTQAVVACPTPGSDVAGGTRRSSPSMIVRLAAGGPK